MKQRFASFDAVERFLVAQAVVAAGLSLVALFKYDMIWAPVLAFFGAAASAAAIFIDDLEKRLARQDS